MHHALEIQEILLNIFDQHDGPNTRITQLAVLARTCRTFKEPALDLLWEDLRDLSPLARCLPDATCQASPMDKCYAFSRPLTQTEWATLQSYTRRIRRIQLKVSGLGRKSIRTISERHTTEPLFQNLHRLRFTYTVRTAPLLRLPLPSISSLDISFFNPFSLRNLLASGSFAKISPTLCDLSIRLLELEIMEAHSLAQLSRTTLTRLELNLSTAFAGEIAASDIIHLFPRLLFLELRSKSLPPISLLLAKSRMPALATLRAYIRECPSRQGASSFLASLQMSGIGSALHELSLVQIAPQSQVRSWSLGMQDLRPCMAFDNLRRMHWDIDCQVDLTDHALITLAPAWPHLECLSINGTQGWSTSGGITPDGLVRLLKTCPSLKDVALAVDTRGFVQLLPSEASLELPSPRKVTIDTVDSTIEEESVPAIAAFFARLSPRFNPLKHSTRTYSMQRDPPSRGVYRTLWRAVHERIEIAVSQEP